MRSLVNLQCNVANGYDIQPSNSTMINRCFIGYMDFVYLSIPTNPPSMLFYVLLCQHIILSTVPQFIQLSVIIAMFGCLTPQTSVHHFTRLNPTLTVRFWWKGPSLYTTEIILKKKTIGDIYGNSVIKWLIEQKKQLTDSAHMYLWWFSLKMFQSSTFISFLSSSETSQVIEVWPVHWILANYTEKYFSEISVYSCNFTLIVSYSQRLNINIAVIYKYK